ncbi:MAG TPA: hypothetical protein VFX18_00210 [Candidatus Nitrosocosmicus sp.]|nr:hypothetical protein [Candidatus Nitrosocosmicus sp.]
MSNNQNKVYCCPGFKNSLENKEITTDGHIYYLCFTTQGLGGSHDTIERPIKGCPYCLTPFKEQP